MIHEGAYESMPEPPLERHGAAVPPCMGQPMGRIPGADAHDRRCALTIFGSPRPKDVTPKSSDMPSQGITLRSMQKQLLWWFAYLRDSTYTHTYSNQPSESNSSLTGGPDAQNSKNRLTLHFALNTRESG